MTDIIVALIETFRDVIIVLVLAFALILAS